MERRDKGNPRRWGSSQASALTWTTRLGGKAGLMPAARLFLQARQSGQGKSLAPLADDLARRIEFGGDEVIGQAFIGKKDDLASETDSPQHEPSTPPFGRRSQSVLRNMKNIISDFDSGSHGG